MIITYFRSSSYNRHDFCPQAYYIDYSLGWKGKSNIRTDMGTIVHKNLEILGKIKLAQQNKIYHIKDDIVGDINVKNYDFDLIIDKVYTYYSELFSHNKWSDSSRKDCIRWTSKVLEKDDGLFDPRNRNVVDVEFKFDFVIDEEWAHYKYGDLEGQLGIKGTIDLITKENDDTYEVIDWKTGKRIDWGTGEIKTHSKLNDDPQLKLYHYAVNHVFTNIDKFIMTINYINYGGPFSFAYNGEHLKSTEKMLRTKMEEIQSCSIPPLKKTWKCKAFCPYGTSTFADTHIPPTIEYRDGQFTSPGYAMTKCQEIEYAIERHGMDFVTNNYNNPEFDITEYGDGGGRTKK